MADPDFFDALVLGAVLLGGVFASVYVGFFLVPAFWILLLVGWPVIIVTLAGYEFLRRSARAEVMRGRSPLLLRPPTTKFCPVCGTFLHIEATDCPTCGLRLLPTYGKTNPPAKFCIECGSPLEGGSRYRRGRCPRCGVYR